MRCSSVYRLVELSGGWDGPVIRTQVYFLVLDGGMVTLAIYTMNIAHPGYLLGPILREKIVEKEVESATSSRV
jgi:hypothetical protein